MQHTPEKIHCPDCGGSTNVQGCAHGTRLDPSQIAWRKACDLHDRIMPPGRPPKNSPPGGWLSIDRVVEETDGLTKSLYEEALYVRRNVVTHAGDSRWGMLDRGEIAVGAVYDSARRSNTAAHNGAGGKITALDAAARRERDRRFTQDDIGEPYRRMVGGDFIDVATEIMPDGKNPMRAMHLLTEDDDGITADWGPVSRPAWCNKPFSLRAPFLARCLQEAARGRHVTYLETDDVSTVVAQAALRHTHEIIACGGRPNYAKPDGSVERNPNFGTVLYGFGGEISEMLAHGLQGTALIPTARVEQMIRAAISAVRGGASDINAIVAAHAAPAVPVPRAVLDTLDSIGQERAA